MAPLFQFPGNKFLILLVRHLYVQLNNQEVNMSIIRVVKNKKNPYLIMNKTGLNDKRLSLKSKGLLCYLLSKPDNWYISTQDIISNNDNARASVFSAINELVRYGYMFKHHQKRLFHFWINQLWIIPHY